MSDFAIETKRLTRYFGDRAALLDLSLTVPRGCVFALLGRNGSGKSTTFRILMGLMEPTRGTAEVLGFDCQNLPPQARARIGYMPEGHPVVSWMRVTELAKFQRATFPKWNQNAFREVLERYQLRESSRAADLSRGERAGVALALTLATEPELILLDEPALGLDPFARRGLLETIVRITRDSQRTILLSSHVLADIERVADEVAILDGAVLRANCSLEHFRSKLVRYVLRYRPDKPIPQVPEPANVPGLLQVTRGAHEIVLSLVNDTPATKQFIDSLAPDECEELPLDLEQAFVDYLGRRPVRAPCDSNMLHGVANK